MVKRAFFRPGALLVLLAFFSAAPAADYYFKVNDLKAVLTVRPDSMIEIRYAITFTPQAGSHPVDIVDIGMPNEEFDLGTARASIAGLPLTDIRHSEFVKPGVEVHLAGNAIFPGRTATLEFVILARRMIYPDSEDGNYASLQFKTTWYDGKYVSGNAERIEVEINLPPGSTPDAVKYHTFGSGGYQPSEKVFADGFVTFRWLWLDQPATVPYSVGASFPRSLVASVYSPPRLSILKALLTAFIAFFAFVFSLSPLWIIVLIVVFAVRSGHRRLQKYLPPRVGIESGGIKRGLTPAEAALLQELPLAKVLLLVVFGLLKKGKLEIKEVVARDFRFHELKKEGLELLEHEKTFISAIDKDNRLDKTLLRAMFIAMIAALKKSMEGFSQRETNQYYHSIMNKAWEQVKNCPPDKLPAELAQSLEWLALDPEYEKKLEPYDTDAVFLPGRTDYWFRHFPQRTPGQRRKLRPGQRLRRDRRRRGQPPGRLPAGILRRPARRQRRVHIVHHQGDQPAAGAALFQFRRPQRRRGQQLRLRLCLRRLRLRLRRRRPMRTYSLKKGITATLVALAAAAFSAAAAARIFSRGRFLAIDLGLSRYGRSEGLLPALLVFLAVLLPLTALLWRAYARKSHKEFLAPGLYHYYDTRKFGARRIHLRLEPDKSAILMIDAYRVVHLNATAAAMVKYFLDDFPLPQSIRRLATAFRVSRKRAEHDYKETLEKIDLLVNHGEFCPVSYFGIDKIEAFQMPVSAPYRMDLALTYRCNIDCSHCYNQRRESAELATGRLEEDHQNVMGQRHPPRRFHRRRTDLARRPAGVDRIRRRPRADHRPAEQRRAPGRREIRRPPAGSRPRLRANHPGIAAAGDSQPHGQQRHLRQNRAGDKKRRRPTDPRDHQQHHHGGQSASNCRAWSLFKKPGRELVRRQLDHQGREIAPPGQRPLRGEAAAPARPPAAAGRARPT